MSENQHSDPKPHCTQCGEPFESGFEVCWKCGTDTDGVSDPEFCHAEENLPNDETWITVLGWVGFLSGTFRVVNEKEDVPLVKKIFAKEELNREELGEEELTAEDLNREDLTKEDAGPRGFGVPQGVILILLGVGSLVVGFDKDGAPIVWCWVVSFLLCLWGVVCLVRRKI